MMIVSVRSVFSCVSSALVLSAQVAHSGRLRSPEDDGR